MKAATIFSIVLLVLSAAFSAGAAADEAADRDAIHELLWRYARALDTMNADAYAAVFTEDGQFGTGQNATKGREALMAMIEGVRESRAEREAAGNPPGPMYHMTTDSWIEFVDDTHARHHSYWLTVFGAAQPGGSPNVAAAGRAIDELVKIDGEWLIKVRDVAPGD